MKKLLILLIALVGVIATPQQTFGQDSPQLEQVLAETVQKAVNLAENTGQWVLDVAPDIIQQYLMWEMVSASFFLGLGILFALISIYTISKTGNMRTSDGDFFMGMCSVACVIWSFLFIVCNTYTILFIKIAPEIYLIKQFL